VASPSSSRLAYIDWTRGLACLLMFQTHCYDSWLGGVARQSKFFMWSQVLGTLPAPLFLFLAGISFAIVTDKLRQKGLPPGQIARTTIRRGAEILALGLLFRLQEFVVSWGWAPWSDLLRLDILNAIGVSMILMGIGCWVALLLMHTSRPRLGLGLMAVSVAAIISLLAPLLWTNWRPRWLPWPLESYVNGVHNLNKPQSWLFPVFPWSAFAFVGLAFGFFLLSDWVRKHEAGMLVLAGPTGIGLIYLGSWLNTLPVQFYAAIDFWHTSPNFFLIRVGWLFAILSAAYVWCRWGLAQRGFSPLIQLGQTSLLVYWVHIEFVYGRISILPKHAVDIPTASLGLVAIFFFMLGLSLLRMELKGRRVEMPGWFRKPVKAI
jgi:uncharacterized membrane protein